MYWLLQNYLSNMFNFFRVELVEFLKSLLVVTLFHKNVFAELFGFINDFSYCFQAYYHGHCKRNEETY